MCASCGCGCKPGKATKGCKCTCKTCRDARTSSVEKSYLVSKALRDFDDIEKGLVDMAYRASQPFVRAGSRAGGMAENAKFALGEAKQGLKGAPGNAKYALSEAKGAVGRRAGAGADRVRFSRAGASIGDKISRIKRGY